MAARRDRVRGLPDQRLDAADWENMQINARSEARSMLATLLFGSETTVATLRKVFGGFSVGIVGGNTLSVTSGAAAGAENRPDGTREYGTLFGREIQTSQTISLVGQPVATLGIWVRFSITPAEPAAKVFWDSSANAGAGAEVADIVETRDVADWDVTVGVVSPGDEWVQIGVVDWNGAAASNLFDRRNYFFEGDSGASFAQVWGDGVNDRSTNRSVGAVGNLYTWVQAVRRQLSDILGVGGGGWFSAIPVSLTTVLAHINATANPHGTSLTQDNLTVNNSITLGTPSNRTITIVGSAFNVEQGTGTLRQFVLNQGRLSPNVDSVLYDLEAEVQLPDGSTINGCVLTITNNSGVTVNFAISIQRTNMTSDAFDTIGTANADVATASTSAITVLSFTNDVVDNGTYGYILKVGFTTPASGSSNIVIHGVRVQVSTAQLLS